MKGDDDETFIEGSGDGRPGDDLLKPGTMLDQYRVERLLGRGGMGAVYLAEHERLKQKYALKVLPQELSGRGDFAERFLNEGQRMAGLRHSGVVPILYAGESGGLHYFAMEYVSGGDLEQRLKTAGGQLPQEEVRSILQQLLEALQYAHSSGVIHRDLKPANILVEGGEGADVKIKITDFGLAEVLGDGYMKSLVERTLTASMLEGAETLIDSGSGRKGSSQVAGTIHYMAPEVLQREAATAQSDLYAVGVIGYHLLTGRIPIGRYRDASKLVNGLSPEWDKFLNGLMASETEYRTANAEAALAMLPEPGQSDSGMIGWQIAEPIEEPSPTKEPTPKPEVSESVKPASPEAVRPKRKRGVGLWLAMVAVLVFLAGLFWWMSGDNFAEEPVLAGQANGLVQEPVVAMLEEEPAGLAVADVVSASLKLRVDPASSGARVWLGPLSDMAVDDSGALSLGELVPGEHELIVQAAGYQPVVTRLALELGANEYTVRLVEIRGTLEVLTSPGARVLAVDSDGHETELGRSDREGLLRSENLLRIGEYELRISAPERQSAEAAVSLSIGRETRLVRMLAPNPGELRILSVPPGAQVRLQGEGAEWSGETPATLREVATEQALSLRVSHRGYRSEHRELELEAGETRTINLGTLVAEAGSVTLEITNPELRNDRNLQLSIDGRSVRARVQNGRLELDGLEVGHRQLHITHPSYQSHASHFTIRDQQSTTHRVELEPLRQAQGREARGPVAGQSAAVELPGGVALDLVWVESMNMWVGKYEVTNEQFRAFRSDHDSGDFSRNNRSFNLNGNRQPVVSVSYEDAQAYCDWLTERERAAGRLPEGYRYRLPNGDEWTAYARCGTNREYPWGNSMPPTRGNYYDEAAHAELSFSGSAISGYRDGHVVTAPVESSGVNEWGLYGVGGNVWEWTSEERGSSRVLRGASWLNIIPDALRVEGRNALPPSRRNAFLGFRVVLGVGG